MKNKEPAAESDFMTGITQKLESSTLEDLQSMKQTLEDCIMVIDMAILMRQSTEDTQ